MEVWKQLQRAAALLVPVGSYTDSTAQRKSIRLVESRSASALLYHRGRLFPIAPPYSVNIMPTFESLRHLSQFRESAAAETRDENSAKHPSTTTPHAQYTARGDNSAVATKLCDIKEPTTDCCGHPPGETGIIRRETDQLPRSHHWKHSEGSAAFG